MRYVSLLRGINVGGNALIRMPALKECYEAAGFTNVKTYIQSGNVLFDAPKEDPLIIAKKITSIIEKAFQLDVSALVIAKNAYVAMIDAVPKAWGEKQDWKYNLLFLIPPYEIDDIIHDIGELKPDIEVMEVGKGVIYQAVLLSSFGRATTGKLASRVSYKKMTVRNWNTARKLRALLDEETAP